MYHLLQIDLNFVNKIAIQKGSTYLDTTLCYGCMSPSEYRLFTVATPTIYDSSSPVSLVAVIVLAARYR